MSRPASHRILLTPDEMIWVTKTITRIAAILTRQPDNNELGITKGERSSVQKLSDKLANLPKQTNFENLVELKSSRVELRILQKLAKNEHAALLTKVIPGYQEKLAEDPKRMKEYLAASEQRASQLVDLMNKIAERVGPT